MEKEQNVIPVNLDFNAKIHNRFDIEVCDAKTGEVKQRAQAFNVICNTLWTSLFSGNTYFQWIHYGSGTGTPAVTDTALFNKINAIEVYGPTVNTTGSGRDKIQSYQKKITLDENTSNGHTITEVGIGYDSTHIATHAMLQDMNGNPISITKTNTDIIYIYATIYIHYFAYSISENSFIVYSTNEDTSIMLSQIAGTRSWSEGRTHYILFSPGVMFAQRIFDNDPQSAYNYKLGSSSFNLATKTMTESVRLLSGEGNYDNGIVSTAFNSGGVIFDVSKTYDLGAFAITGESLGSGDGSKTTFKSKYPINSSAKVYVDGVEQSSGVTILDGPFKEFHKIHKIYNDSGFIMFPPLRAYENRNIIIENENNATFTGLCYVKGDNDSISTTVYGSNNFNGPWTTLYSGYQGGTGVKTCNFSSSTSYKYYKINLDQRTYSGHVITDLFLISPDDKTYNVIFDTPPAVGSIITIDYIPNCIPKDSNHVLDLTFSITLGEYSGN